MKEFEKFMEQVRWNASPNNIFDIFISTNVNVADLFSSPHRRYNFDLHDRTLWLNIWSDILIIGQEALNE